MLRLQTAASRLEVRLSASRADTLTRCCYDPYWGVTAEGMRRIPVVQSDSGLLSGELAVARSLRTAAEPNRLRAAFGLHVEAPVIMPTGVDLSFFRTKQALSHRYQITATSSCAKLACTPSHWREHHSRISSKLGQQANRQAATPGSR